MHRFRSTATCLVLLPIIAAGMFVALVLSQNSFTNYRPPVRDALPVTEGTTPVGQQVVLFIIDGLRYDTSLKLPFLQSLAARGASAVMTSTAPSYSQTAWTTLVTGAWPELNGAAPLNAELDQIRPIAVDNLFAGVRRAGMTAVVCGHYWWSKMVPADLLLGSVYVEGEDDAADEQVANGAIRLLNEKRPNFAVVHLDQVDLASHQHGGASQQALEAALRADALVRRIIEQASLDKALVIVVSDHGHIARGGHGGLDAAVVTEPFVMVGPRVAPGSYPPIRQADVAPTIAAILGSGPPSSSQGRQLLEMLQVGEAERTAKLVVLARQRIELGNRYLFSIDQGTLSEAAEGDAAVAESSVQVGNYGSAARLAQYAVEQVDAEMDQGRARKIAAERAVRRIPAILGVVLPLFLLYRRQSVRTLVSVAASLVALGVYHLYFWRTGNVYSLSTIPEMTPFLTLTVTGLALGLLAGALIVSARLWAERERSARAVVRTTYGFVFITLYWLWVQAVLAFYYNGLATTWRLPDMRWAFIQLAAMLQMAGVAALGLALPGVTLLFTLGLPRAARRARPALLGAWDAVRRVTRR